MLRVVQRGRTDGQVDVTKLTVALRNFANAPKNCEKCNQRHSLSHDTSVAAEGDRRPEAAS